MCRSVMSDTEISSGWAPDSLPIISPVCALMESSATQILQLALEQSRVTLSSVDTIKDYHPLRLSFFPVIQRKIGEEVWTKLELGHRGKLEYAAVLESVSENLRRDSARDRQGPGDLLSFGRLDFLDPFFQLC